MGLEVGIGEAAEADRPVVGLERHREEAEAGFGDAATDAVEQRVRFLPAAAMGKEFHHLGVAIDLEEEIAVVLLPGADAQPFGLRNDHLTKSVLR
ncbi:hypothetical protein D3C71_2014790 [compost metagenome]